MRWWRRAASPLTRGPGARRRGRGSFWGRQRGSLGKLLSETSLTLETEKGITENKIFILQSQKENYQMIYLKCI